MQGYTAAIQAHIAPVQTCIGSVRNRTTWKQAFIAALYPYIVSL